MEAARLMRGGEMQTQAGLVTFPTIRHGGSECTAGAAPPVKIQYAGSDDLHRGTTVEQRGATAFAFMAAALIAAQLVAAWQYLA
jgi:hypothetical protein